MGISQKLLRGSIDRSIGTARELQSKGAQIVFYGKCSKEIITSESRLTDGTSERPRTIVGAPSTRESVSRPRGLARNPPDRESSCRLETSAPSILKNLHRAIRSKERLAERRVGNTQWRHQLITVRRANELDQVVRARIKASAGRTPCSAQI